MPRPRQLGRDGVARLIDANCASAHALATGIGARLVRFLDPRLGAGEVDHDRHTDAVTEAVLASGESLFSNSTWRGQRCMRISVCSWQTCASDVERAIAAVKQALLDSSIRARPLP